LEADFLFFLIVVAGVVGAVAGGDEVGVSITVALVE